MQLRHQNRITRDKRPDLFAQMYDYNIQDIRAETAVSLATPDLSPFELQVWQLSEQINVRGVQIDQDALHDCLAIIEQAKTKYTEEIRQITGLPEVTIDQLEVLKQWMYAQGCSMYSLAADYVDEMLKQDFIPPNVRRILEIRASLGSNSVKKLDAIKRHINSDGRLRDLFVYCGARQTGRYAGAGPQPQNMPSSGPAVVECKSCKHVYWIKHSQCTDCGSTESKESDWGITAAEEALKDISTRNLDHVERMWGDAILAVAGCLRSLFIAADGYDLLCSDFSAIEAVVLAEIAQEHWRQEVFRTHGKIYEMCAASITGVPFDEIMDYKKRNKVHHPHRKKYGKIPELASGYQGSVGAWKNFGADKFMSDDEILENVRKWRDASPNIRNFWYRIEDTAKTAVKNPGQCYSYNGISYGMKNGNLYCQLPSGRLLTYHKAFLRTELNQWDKYKENICFWGWNSDSTKGPIGWLERDTYGGKLTENIVQAISRDLLVYAMVNLANAGYQIVLHVHDEIVAEVVKGYDNIEHFEQLMSTMPPWARSVNFGDMWPIKAAGGWLGKRYRKD